MKQYSTIFLLLIVLFAAAILYIVTKPPGDVTLKEMLKVNPPPIDTQTSQEQPVSVDSIIHDTVKSITVEKTGIFYYIIVESATNQDLARVKTEKLKNTFRSDFIVLPPTKEGLYRISKGKYSTLEDAKTAIDDVRRNIRTDAWIFSLKN